MFKRFSLYRRSIRLRQLLVLMYHRVSADGSGDALTIPVTDLATQFQYLQQQGYAPVLLSDLVAYIQSGTPLPPKPVLITFDDGYRDNYTLLYPLLKLYAMKANIFLVASFIQREPDVGTDTYLRVTDIQAMDAAYVEFGLHSYDHRNYKNLLPAELANDIALSKILLSTLGITFQPCVAFPYGAYPKRNLLRQRRFFGILAQNNIVAAFRIGNRINPLPLREPLLIQRFDIRGDAPFQKFEHVTGKAHADGKLLHSHQQLL
jgi:peptidoglycan/xylan/chitin deacetylase (PgdA/CDA1 family)